MFDSPLAGVPIAVFGVQRDEEMMLLTEGGRGLRWSLQKLPLIGLQAINLGRESRLSHAFVGKEEREAVIVTADGYGRKVQLGALEHAPKANSHGRSLIARQSPVAALAAMPESEPLWVVTSQGITAVDVSGLPASISTSTDRLLRLDRDEVVQTTVR
jgi:hypothetical protein